jgi:hypothetical protein
MHSSRRSPSRGAVTRSRFGLLLGIGGLCAFNLADAHHSFGTFDMNKNIELVGTIAGIDFVNPHSWLRVDTRAADGSALTYRCEMRGATVLRRSGWSPEMFVIGAPITVQGAPDRVDPRACYVNTLVLGDGRTFDRYTQREAPAVATTADSPATTMPRMPSGVPNLAGDWAVEQQVMSDPRGRAGTLVPVSSSARFAGGVVPRNSLTIPGSQGFGVFATVAMLYRIAVGAVSPNGLPWIDRAVRLTKRGAAAVPPQARHPQMLCQPTSIIFNWYMETLVNRITQDDTTLTIEYGSGLVRTVHLNAEHPVGIDPSRAGHSIGRWDGDVLDVDTVGFLPGMLANEVPHGPDLHVIERFALNADGSVLTRDYRATDPDYFVGEYTGTDPTPRSPVPFTVDVCDAALNPYRE